jgi:ABC-type Na+ efflux pump permease subunit
VTAVLRLELAKLLGSSKNAFYLLLPNVYAVCYQVVLVIAMLRGSETLLGLLGAGLTSFVIVHGTVGIFVYPMCIMLLVTDLWCTELSDRSLRTLLLTQVPRGQLLLGRVIAVTGVMVTAYVIFFVTFFVDAAVLSHVLTPELWERVKFDVGMAAGRMVLYTGALAVAIAAATLFFTVLSLLSNRVSTVAMIGVLTVLAMAVGLPYLVSYYRPGATWPDLLFVHPYRELMSKDLVRSLMLEPAFEMSRLGWLTGLLIANSVALYALALAMLKRKQFVD